jgi:hypothetical protein
MSEHSSAIKRRVEEDSSSTLKLTRLCHLYEKLNQASEQTYDTAVLLLRSIFTLILWARVVESAVVINLSTIATDTSGSELIVVGSVRAFEGVRIVRHADPPFSPS